MGVPQGLQVGLDSFSIASFAGFQRGQQSIRDLRHGRDHDRNRAFARLLGHKADSARYRFGRADARPAELHHEQGIGHRWHCG